MGGSACAISDKPFDIALCLTLNMKTRDVAVQIISREHVKMLVWERGAGRTLACGTGACAAVVAGVLEGKIDRNCR